MKVKSFLALVGLLLISACTFQLFQLTKIRKFQEDEHIFVRRGIFADYYLSGKFQDPIWQSFDSVDVPKFAELFYGVILRLHAGKDAADYLATVPKFLNPITTVDFLWPSIYAHEWCCTIQDLPEEIQRRLEPVLIARQYSLVFPFAFLAVIFLGLVKISTN